MPEQWPVQHLFDLPIAAMTMGDALGVVEQTIHDRRRLLIGVVNAAKIVNMRRDEALDWSVRTSDLILADGMSVVWASRILGRRLPERVAGIDLMTEMMRLADARGFRVYFLGAKQEVLDSVLDHVRREYPRLVIAGSHHGYFNESQEAPIAAHIADARPDMLFVAMTSPKKEQFLARWADTMDVRVCHGVGGSFDVIAGKVRRAPAVWQRLGVEWLYRVIQEPGRMWKRYLVTNTLFCGLVISSIFGRGRRPARPAQAT